MDLPEIKTEKHELFSPFVKQLYSTICAALLVIGCTSSFSYSAILLPQLKAEKDIVEVDPASSSWIGSMPILAMPISNILGGYMVFRLGRKRSHQIAAVPITIGWVTLALAKSYTVLLLGRFLQGVSVGFQVSLSSVYIGESSSPKYRGILLPFISLGLTVAFFMCHLLGTFFHWRVVAWVCGIFSVLSGILISFTPDTPSWFVLRGKTDKARSSFRYYRGKGAEIEELSAMINRSQEPALTLMEKIKEIKKPEFYKPWIIVFSLFMLIHFSGCVALPFYTIQILDESIGGVVDSYVVMLVLDAVRLAFSIIAVVILDRCKRRTIALTTGILTIVSLLALSIHLYLVKLDLMPEYLRWGPILYLIVYVIAMAIGIVPLPWAMLGELFPLRLRSLGVTLSSAFSYSVMLYVASKSAPYMFESWGMHGTFAFYAGVTFFFVCIVYKMLPETKGKTLEEIGDYFAKK